jgi:hypothetical protein
MFSTAHASVQQMMRPPILHDHCQKCQGGQRSAEHSGRLLAGALQLDFPGSSLKSTPFVDFHLFSENDCSLRAQHLCGEP